MPFIIRVCVLGWLVLILNGCTGITSLMFFPLEEYPATPAQLGFEFEVVKLQAHDGTKLHNWWMPAQGQAKGNVMFLHGNAQNMSYHQFNIHWLVKSGYNVFLLGYREYGKSEGHAMLPDIFMDVYAGLDWMVARHDDLPLVLFGQSMGATLAVYGLGSYPQKDKVDAVVLDAAFASYPDMAAEAMSRNWFTWLLQLPALAITSKYDPVEWIDQWGNKPLLMLHSPDDQTVPYEAGEQLFAKALEPKQWITTMGPHTRTFRFVKYQQIFLDFIAQLPVESNK